MLARRARGDELLGGRIGVFHVQGKANRSGGPAPNLDVVERLGLEGVEQLEGGPSGIEDRPAAVRAVPRLDLGQPERIPIEGDRPIVVLDGQGNAELVDSGHAATVAIGPFQGRRARPDWGTMTTVGAPGTLASWGELAAGSPELAAAGARHLDRGQGAALLATVRGNESAPRIHPVTVGIVDGGLYVFLLDSAKRLDLVEDGRYALHAAQDKAAPDEFSVRGRARRIPQGALRDRVADGWYFEVDDTYWLFELQLQTAILGERAADEWPPRYRRWSAGA